MRIKQFDMAKADWDRYKRFHTFEGSQWKAKWVQFENDELYFLHGATLKSNRDMYHFNRIDIVSTADPEMDYKFATPDDPKTPLKKAWLDDYGQQILIVDLDHKTAVAMGNTVNVGGRKMTGVQAYCPGDGGRVVGGAKIKVTKPCSKEIRAKLTENIDFCRAWWAHAQGKNPDLKVKRRNAWGLPDEYTLYDGTEPPVTHGAHGQKMPAKDRTRGPVYALWGGKPKDAKDYSEVERAIIAEFGYVKRSDRVSTPYTHLKVL